MKDLVIVGVGVGSFGWVFIGMEDVVGVGWMEFFFRIVMVIVRMVKKIVGLRVIRV